MVMISDDDADCVRALRIVVLIFGLLHTLIRGVELLLSILSTFFMIAPLVAGNPTAFKNFLNDESMKALWKGPYPQNITENLDSLGETESAIQLRVDLHLWSSYLLMQCIIFVFGWILVFSTKSKSCSGLIAWLSFSIPVYLQSLVHFVLDLSFWDYPGRLLLSQIHQGFDIAFQPIGLILVACFLYQIKDKRDELRRIDRYNEQNGFPRNTGAITIRQILEDDRF